MEIKTSEISVVIPLYNKAPYIKRAIDSILSQTVQDFEIIVINDGSIDGGEKIVEEYCDSRILLINQENRGVSATRNRGVEMASSELIAFLDADDEWLPEFLETILRLRKEFPDAGMYGTGYVQITQDKHIVKIYHPDLGDRKLTSFFSAKMDFCNGVGMLISTSGMAVDKLIYQTVGGFPEGYKMCEDRALRGKIALVSDVVYSPDICVIYHNNTINNSSEHMDYLADAFSDYVRENYYLIEKRFDYADILDFCVVNQLGLIGRNIRNNPHMRRRELCDLLQIHQTKYLPRKLLLMLYCLTPIRLRKLGINVYHLIHPNNTT